VLIHHKERVMQMLLTFIGSHLLTILESLLVQEEPVIVAQVEKEAQLLISKIQSLLQSKSPAAAAALNPAINLVGTLANDAVAASGNAIVQDALKAS
jgi:hypothetical protein